MKNESSALACFMATPAGRGIRIVAGLVLVAVGWSKLGGTAGTMWVGAGLVPLLAGIFNVCLIAPVIGAPFSGRASLDATCGG